MDVRIVVKSNRFPQAPALLRRGVAAGFKASERPLLEDMQRRTPVDTEALRKSERVESDDQRLVLRAGDIESGGEVGYAEFVHQGARGEEARPYMREALHAGAEMVQRNIVDAADRELA